MPSYRHRHAGIGQAPAVRLAFVPERVVLGDHDQRRRQAGEVGGEQRRRVRMRSIFRSRVLIPVPAELGGGDEIPLAVLVK
jgi:hypothetical protein